MGSVAMKTDVAIVSKMAMNLKGLRLTKRPAKVYTHDLKK